MLKDFINQDLSAFFNSNEFSETHNINGKDVSIVKDHELLKEREVKCAEGTYLGDLLFHIKAEDFGEEPAIGAVIIYDNEPMKITDFEENMGVYTITLGEMLS